MSLKLLTIRDVAGLLQISESGLRKLVRQGKIPCMVLGPRTLRFDPEALDLWRKQFFKIDECVPAATQEEMPGLSNHGQRMDVESITRQGRPMQGRVPRARPHRLGPVAQKTAKRLLEIEEAGKRARNSKGSQKD